MTLVVVEGDEGVAAQLSATEHPAFYVQQHNVVPVALLRDFRDEMITFAPDRKMNLTSLVTEVLVHRGATVVLASTAEAVLTARTLAELLAVPMLSAAETNWFQRAEQVCATQPAEVARDRSTR